MTNQEIQSKMVELVKRERRTTNEILELINLAFDQKLHLDLGFSSLFDWLVRGHGYSESAAQRRIQAARLLRTVPEISEKLENGSMTLTGAAKVQSVLSVQEKMSGEKVSRETKKQVIEQIEKQSTIQMERTLISIFPDTASQVYQERKTVIDENQSRLSVNLSNDVIKDLERVRDLLSHALPTASFAEIIAHLSGEYLKRNDPLLKTSKDQRQTEELQLGKYSLTDQSAEISLNGSTAVAAKRCVSLNSHSRYIPASLRRQVIQKAKGRCEYKDPATGRVCNSTWQIEVDHIYPRALGGTNTIDNLRCLCRSHNFLMANKILGEKWANRWRNRSVRINCSHRQEGK